MGLDQYAYTRRDDQLAKECGFQFTWRKHAKLQTWAEELYVERTGKSIGDLNCDELELTQEDIQNLKGLIGADKLPESQGGFFYGHQWQDETANDYRNYDLEFCAWAQYQFAQGNRVYYSCWW